MKLITQSYIMCLISGKTNNNVDKENLAKIMLQQLSNFRDI